MVNMVCFLFNGNFVRALENDGDEKVMCDGDDDDTLN